MADDVPSRPLDELPSQEDDPIVWDPAQRRFVPTSERRAGAAPVAPKDARKFFIGADAVGRELPPQPGSPPPGAARIPLPGTPSAPGPGATSALRPGPPPVAAPGIVVPAPERPPALPRPRPNPPAVSPDRAPSAKRKRRVRLLHRPKLRTVLLLVPLVPILLAGLGLWYANQRFQELRRVPVGALMDSGGSGQNILIVGSDTRDDIAVDPANSGVFGDATERAPTGQRSDTIMLLRMDAQGARILSIPRDLIVTIAESGEKTRINAAYNTDLGGGPARLIKTVKDNLGIPVNRYMEVDFGTFAGVVDAVGGITIDFPNPAFDENTGLDIKTAGPVVLNGEQALQYVRSRYYTEVINGKNVRDTTADLGRIKRQQQFLTAVLGKVGRSKNPLTLLQVGGEVVKGLRVDDKLGLWDAIKLGWDLKGLRPASVDLPTVVNRDGATLRLVEPDAQQVLATFR